MGGGFESRCVDRVYGADGAVVRHEVFFVLDVASCDVPTRNILEVRAVATFRPQDLRLH